MSENYWKQPIKWNAAAKKAGVPAKVFCSSMADVFEGHHQTAEHLVRLFQLILDTPWLTWQLLTKRPENILALIPRAWQFDFPKNVITGTSVENQEATERIRKLLQVPGPHFLSCEPLLGPLFLQGDHGRFSYNWLNDTGIGNKIDWVIVGGESGPHARPMHPDWARSLRDQCQAAGVAFHFKQWGEYGTRWVNFTTDEPAFKMYKSYLQFTQKLWVNKGDACISIDGRICKIGKDFMDCAYPVAIMQKVGKKAAGRLLDGRTWDEFPSVNRLKQ